MAIGGDGWSKGVEGGEGGASVRVEYLLSHDQIGVFVALIGQLQV